MIQQVQTKLLSNTVHVVRPFPFLRLIRGLAIKK